MFKKILLAGFFFALAGTVTPSHAEVDEDFMQTVEDTHKSLASNLATQTTENAVTDAKLLEGYFAEIEAFFVKKPDAQDGVDWSKKSRELVSQIITTLAANDFEGAQKAHAELGRTCKDCHRKYNDD
ncbi:hypothetical protein [Methylococcus sp. EFPC2]|uniref:hypothetical protein n=1 Tax=Methylococcus sp. EFPC2 TaxID=2812648 RepID=UPI001966DE1F|nr:hypothetical protein [Methylococcus sp. EFPC2]QSA96428.1 hypothetical protein JWZ97_14550 [Methylococcus sp. EFPC2]